MFIYLLAHDTPCHILVTPNCSASFSSIRAGRLSASSSLLTHLLQKSLARTTISSWTFRLRKPLQPQLKLWMGRPRNGVAHFGSILRGTTPIAKSTVSSTTGMHHRMLLPEISRRIGAQRANWSLAHRYDQARSSLISLYPTVTSNSRWQG